MILGIDPSTVSTGWALMSGSVSRGTTINSYGVIKLKGTMIERVGKFFHELFQILIENEVNCIAIETPFVGKNIATYGKLSMLRGAIYVLANQFSIEVIELPPTKVKQLITARGNATKQELASVLKKRYSKLPDNLCDDITDAIGIAYSGLIMFQYKGTANEERKAKKRKTKK